MIAFDNFEKTTRQYAEKYPYDSSEYETLLAERRAIKPVIEEFIVNEPDTPNGFPKMKE